MTATGNPAAALLAASQALALKRGDTDYYTLRAKAQTLVAEALRGAPVPSASLETAACVWEAVLEMEGFTAPAGKDDEYKRQTARAAAIAAARELLGSSHLRLTVLEWVPLIDAAWKAADTSGGMVPGGGEYCGAFDWEFVPDWIVANVYWDAINVPRVDAAAALAQGNEWGGVAPAAADDAGDLFGVMIGHGANPIGSLIPATFTDYDDAQAEADRRANAPGRWACVYQLRSGGAKVEHVETNDDPPAAIIADAIDLLERVDGVVQSDDHNGFFTFHPNDGGAPVTYRFTVTRDN